MTGIRVEAEVLTAPQLPLKVELIVRPSSGRHKNSVTRVTLFFVDLAEPTGLEPATSDVTGRRSNQLNYDSASKPKISDVSPKSNL